MARLLAQAPPDDCLTASGFAPTLYWRDALMKRFGAHAAGMSLARLAGGFARDAPRLERPSVSSDQRAPTVTLTITLPHPPVGIDILCHFAPFC